MYTAQNELPKVVYETQISIHKMNFAPKKEGGCLSSSQPPSFIISMLVKSSSTNLCS